MPENTNPTPNPPAVAEVVASGSNKVPWTLLLVTIIVVGLVIAWMVPAYKSVKDENLKLKTENLTLKTQLNEHKSTVTYYPNGHIKSKTDFSLNKKTTETDARVDLSDTKHEEVTKRGIASVGLLWDNSLLPHGADFDANIVGPLSATGIVIWDDGPKGDGVKAMVGPKVSF
jgi:hypothetical protein